MQKTKLYADYIQSIKMDKKMSESYLYVIKLVESTEEQLEWSGAFNSLKASIAKFQRKIEEHSKVSAEERNQIYAKIDKI